MSSLSLFATFSDEQIVDIASINGWSPEITTIELQDVTVDEVTHAIQVEVKKPNPLTAEYFIKNQLEKLVSDYIINSYWKIKQQEIDQLTAEHHDLVRGMIQEQITISLT